MDAKEFMRKNEEDRRGPRTELADGSSAPACSPKRPYESKRGARGHVWKRDEDGTIDIFAYNPSEYCNGPQCVKCGYGFCHHCHVGPQVSCTANAENQALTR